MVDSANRSRQPGKEAWQAKQIEEALAFRTVFEKVVRDFEVGLNFDDFGPDAHHEVEVSFAHKRGSYHWFTLGLKCAVLVKLLDSDLVTADKDSIMLLPGRLTGGRSPEGARKVKANVEGLHLVTLDFDKGDAPLERLSTRVKELGLQGVMYATFSHKKDTTELPWAVTKPDSRTGQVETKPTAIQTFVRGRLGLAAGDELDPRQVTPEIVKRSWSRSRALTVTFSAT